MTLTMDFPRSALFVVLEQRPSTKHQNGLNIFLVAVVVVHLLHNEVVKDQLLLARLHDTFYGR